MEDKLSSKDLILKHAYGLFLKKGYKSVSIKDIMKVSKMSKGAIYHHFESKEDIFLNTLDQYYFQAFNEFSLSLKNHTFRERIREIYLFATGLYSKAESLGESGIYFPIRNFYMFQLECEGFEAVRERIKKNARAYRTHIQECTEKGIQNKEIRAGLDPETISYQIVGMIEGIGIHHSTSKENIYETLKMKYEQVFESYFDLICTDGQVGN